MNFLKKLGSLLVPSTTGSADPGLYYYVKCSRCGEIIKVRINPMNEMTPNDDNTRFVRKVIIGRKCYQSIEAEFTFKSGLKLDHSDITGGELVTKADYDAQVQAEQEKAGS